MRRQFQDILLYDGKETTGAFGYFDGITAAVKLTGTAFDAALLKGQSSLFIVERQDPVGTDVYAGSAAGACVVVKCNHRYTPVIINAAKLAA